jgi:hypothetical protein
VIEMIDNAVRVLFVFLGGNQPETDRFLVRAHRSGADPRILRAEHRSQHHGYSWHDEGHAEQTSRPDLRATPYRERVA